VHVPVELMRQAADINVTFIPYKGAEMVNDMMAGRVDLTITGTAAAVLVKAGKLVALASTGARRWDPLPDTPTWKESGINVEYHVWFGLATAPGTPPAIVSALTNAYAAALKSPDVLKAFKGWGYTPAARALNTKEFTEMIQVQFYVWEPIIRKAGIKIN